MRTIECTADELITTDQPICEDGDPIIRRWNKDTLELCRPSDSL